MAEVRKGHLPALSVRQPWAELIISGKKSIEIRSWPTRYRGRLWLHTGRNSDTALELSYRLTNLFHGGYIGSVILDEIIPFDEVIWKQLKSRHLDAGDYQPGLYAWLLSNPRRFDKPISGPGSTLLFQVSAELERKLEQAQLEIPR